MTGESSSLTDALAWVEGPGAAGTFDEAWLQGRTVFGGVVAAALLRAMRPLVPAERRPRSLLIAFVGPVDDSTVQVQARLLRAGGSASHLRAELTQQGQVRCSALGLFAAERDSHVSLAAAPPPAVAAPETLAEMPYIEGVTPVVTGRFAYRWAEGAYPFTGATDSRMGGWCRLRQGAGALREEALLALIDAWPPAVFPLLKRPAPASSASWSVSFLEPLQPGGLGQWTQFQGQANWCAGGYADTAAGLWDRQGRPLALSRQLVAIFA